MFHSFSTGTAPQGFGELRQDATRLLLWLLSPAQAPMQWWEDVGTVGDVLRVAVMGRAPVVAVVEGCRSQPLVLSDPSLKYLLC